MALLLLQVRLFARQPGTFTFDYDESGNMVKDSRKRLEISLNVLNLPMIARDTVGTMISTMTYTFLGDGFITDHLGNVAAVVNLSAPASTSNANAILEQDEYYPFGTKMENAGMKTQTTNRYRYAGKEEQDIAGMDLSLLDFGARYYDAYTCRWNAIDPLAHKYFGMSPYNYCGNDPVNRFDPDGMTDYFDNDGNFLYNDGEDNGEMRTLDALHFWGLVIESIQNGYSSNESNSKLYAVSTAVKDSDLTDDALISIANYYNQTEYMIVNGGANPGAQFTSRNDGQNHSVLIHADISNCKSAGFFHNSYNLINTINAHEKYHSDQITYNYHEYKKQSKEQHEIDAIISQMNHYSWERMSPFLTRWFNDKLIELKDKVKTENQ